MGGWRGEVSLLWIREAEFVLDNWLDVGIIIKDGFEICDLGG